jgi:hypothetical protein
VEGGDGRQSPVMTHVFRQGDWFSLPAMLYRVTGAGEITPDDPEGFRRTHQQLGERANLSRHHVGRKLAALEAAGWIACGYNRIRLVDAEGLAAFAYGDDEV